MYFFFYFVRPMSRFLLKKQNTPLPTFVLVDIADEYSDLLRYFFCKVLDWFYWTFFFFCCSVMILLMLVAIKCSGVVIFWHSSMKISSDRAFTAVVPCLGREVTESSLALLLGCWAPLPTARGSRGSLGLLRLSSKKKETDTIRKN